MSQSTSNYVHDYLSPEIIQRLEAGAFQNVCSHLRDRSEQVQNIDLMTISGFCRNCLAKVGDRNRTFQGFGFLLRSRSRSFAFLMSFADSGW